MTSPQRTYLSTTIYTSLYKLAILSMGILSSALVARGLGPGGQGQLSIMVTMFTLVSAHSGLGLARSAMIRIAEVGGLHLAFLRRVLSFSVGVSVVVVAALGWAMTELGFSDDPIILVPFLVAASLETIAEALRSMLRGLRRYLTVEATATAVRALRLAAVAGLFLSGGLDLRTMALLYLAMSALSSLVLGRFTLGHTSRAPDPAPMDLWAMLRQGLAYETVVFLALVMYRVDQVLLYEMVGKAEVGQYSVAVLLAEQLWFAIAAVGSMHATEIAAQDADRRTALTSQVHRVIVSLVALGALVLGALAWPVIRLLFGPEYQGAPAALVALLPGVVTFASFKVLWRDFYGRRRMIQPVVSMVVAVAANVALNMALIPSLGSVGAAMASSLSYTMAAGMLLVSFLRLEGDATLASMLLPTRGDLQRVVRAVRSRLG